MGQHNCSSKVVAPPGLRRRAAGRRDAPAHGLPPAPAKPAPGAPARPAVPRYLSHRAALARAGGYGDPGRAWTVRIRAALVAGCRIARRTASARAVHWPDRAPSLARQHAAPPPPSPSSRADSRAPAAPPPPPSSSGAARWPARWNSGRRGVDRATGWRSCHTACRRRPRGASARGARRFGRCAAGLDAVRPAACSRPSVNDKISGCFRPARRRHPFLRRRPVPQHGLSHGLDRGPLGAQRPCLRTLCLGTSALVIVRAAVGYCNPSPYIGLASLLYHVPRVDKVHARRRPRHGRSCRDFVASYEAVDVPSAPHQFSLHSRASGKRPPLYTCRTAAAGRASGRRPLALPARPHPASAFASLACRYSGSLAAAPPPPSSSSTPSGCRSHARRQPPRRPAALPECHGHRRTCLTWRRARARCQAMR